MSSVVNSQEAILVATSSVELQEEGGAVGVNVTLPRAVFDAIAALIRDRPELSWDNALAQACSLWVLQQGVGGHEINQAYLGATLSKFQIFELNKRWCPCSRWRGQ